MSRMDMMPAMPYASAYVAGVLVTILTGGIPLFVALLICLPLLAVGWLLRSNEHYRVLPLIVMMFVLAIGYSKENIQIRCAASQTENIAVSNTSASSRLALKGLFIREKILDSLYDEGLTGEEFSVVAAMAFGEKRGLDKDMRNDYSIAGTSHLLALSGMHLSILFMLLTFLFYPFKFVGKALVIISIWMYVVLTGMPISVVRAAVMITIYALISVAGRNKMSVNALCITAIIMLMYNPLQIKEVSFQLSFAALLSILVFYTPIYNIFARESLFRHPFIRKIWKMLSVTTAAQIGTAPLVAFYFGRFSCYSLLSNLIAIPIVTLLLYMVCMMFVTWVVPFLRVFFLKLVYVLALALNKSVGFVASLPGASIENISINWVELMLIYGMVITLAVIMRKVLIQR